ncbi:MAG: polymer-forming cytoskeletal protein [Acidobacteriota bacterium]
MRSKDKEKLKSFLGADSEVKGEFVAKGILRVDGSVIGKIEADQVILGQTAFMQGDILAKCIMVDGKVEGNMRATDRLEISARGKVKGEIFTQKLLIEDGAEFNGRVEMNTAGSKVLDYQSINQETAIKGA